MQNDFAQKSAQAVNLPSAFGKMGKRMPEQQLVHVVDDEEAVRQ
jgi:hypothetical protein